MTGYPEPSFAHLRRLSDDTGLFEHARGSVPRREHGYCVDDVSRGLVVICREPEPSAALVDLAARYLGFLAHAQAANGAFHNRLSYQRQWLDHADVGDWWGRALWGLGTAAARGPAAWLRKDSFVHFEAAAQQRSRWPRAMAFAALGAAEVLTASPDHEAARHLLADAATTIGRPGSDPNWPWPEPRLTYANAVLAEALIAAGHHLGHDATTANGLNMLAWLLDVESVGGHLSPAPTKGWSAGQPRPGFDQQPIEPAAMADACFRASTVTGERRWADGLRLAIGWFLGDNDADVEMGDTETGGGSDGLSSAGRSDNQGAESTLALISTLQQGRRLAGGPGRSIDRIADRGTAVPLAPSELGGPVRRR